MLPRRRLEKILDRVQEIETLLAEPEVARNASRVQTLTKELADLSGLARPFRELLKTEKEIQEIFG